MSKAVRVLVVIAAISALIAVLAWRGGEQAVTRIEQPVAIDALAK